MPFEDTLGLVCCFLFYLLIIQRMASLFEADRFFNILWERLWSVLNLVSISLCTANYDMLVLVLFRDILIVLFKYSRVVLRVRSSPDWILTTSGVFQMVGEDFGRTNHQELPFCFTIAFLASDRVHWNNIGLLKSSNDTYPSEIISIKGLLSLNWIGL